MHELNDNEIFRTEDGRQRRHKYSNLSIVVIRICLLCNAHSAEIDAHANLVYSLLSYRSILIVADADEENEPASYDLPFH